MTLKYEVENSMIGNIRLNTDEIDALYKRVLSSKGNWAEIGTYFGGSAIIIAKALPSEFIIYTIDPTHAALWKRDVEDKFKTRTQEDIILENINTFNFNNKILFIKKKSYPWPLHSLPIYGIFIDGSHRERNVREDFQSALSTGAKVIAVHDYGWKWCKHVKPIADEILLPHSKKWELTNTLMIYDM